MTRLTTAPVPPDDAYLILQKEAAEKFLGEPRESLFAVLLQPCFALELLHSFRRSDFVPAPRIDVVMLRLRKRGPPLVAPSDMPLFRDFVIYCFTAPFPSLGRTLKGLFTFDQFKRLEPCLDSGVDVTPTSLHIEQWLRLFGCFQLGASAQARAAVRGSELRLRHRQASLEKIHRTRVSKGEKR